MLNAFEMLAANNLFDTILNLFSQIGQFASSEGLTSGFQTIFFVSLAFFIIGIVVCIILISRTYETRLLRCVSGFNRYFKKNPFINEDNLVEVNQKFKQVPKTLRYCWTEYMLNRDRQPSEYINSVTCIDQPTRSSSYKNISNTVLFITIMVSALTVLANLICAYPMYMGEGIDAPAVELTVWFQVLLFPLVYLFIGMFIVTFLKLMESSRYADLYYEFHEFERYLNKACSTMPSFVDYEVLFDAKEIREAIPVLQEYLEKRALQEQKEAEEAEMNANHFENFNFEPVGVESALLLDRAMSEGERYFNFKRGMTERINSKETEMFNYQKKFDEVTKDYERKSQAVRENMASINEQLNATSVKIEANYLKKRYNEEQQKQQQLEKDYEYAQINFTKQQQEMEQDIAQLTAEIKEKKAQVEENMMSECRNYSNKVWGEINKSLQSQQEPILKEKEERARILQEEIDKMTLLVADQDADIKAKQEYISKLEQDIKVRIAEIEAINNVRDYFNTPEFRQRVSDKKKKRKLEEYEEEQEEKIEEQKNTIAAIVSTDKRDDKMKQEENELLAKLKEVNKANSEYAKEIEEINERARVAADNEANPFKTFSNLQQNIADEEKQQKAEELAKNAEEQEKKEETPVETEEKVEEPVEEEKKEEQPAEAPKKKTSLQSLLSSAKNLKK
ncbi:MAG: hypothetical protein IJW59_03940 [Clostridia bacterium]|nr:hypothetical protein [Clostridia bacterium]